MVAVFQKVDDFQPMVFRRRGEHGLILLYARELSDITRMQGFLSTAGYQYQSAASLSKQPLDTEFFAVIVCHREAGSGVQIPLSDWDNARVVIVSDNCDEELVVSSLTGGAHYFFDLADNDRVLSARLESALRQHSRAAKKPMTMGDIQFNIQKRKVSRAGCAIDLSPKEFDFAFYLFSNRDRIVGNNELMTSVWSLPSDMDTRRIDTAACRVRKKLSLFADQGWELKRIRRVGYRLDQLQDRTVDHASAVDHSQKPEPSEVVAIDSTQFRQRKAAMV